MDSDVGADGDSDRHIDSQIGYAPRHSALNAGHNIWVAGPRPLAEMGANFDRAVRACVRRETVSFRGVRNTFLKAAKGGKAGLRLSGNGSELGGARPIPIDRPCRSRSISAPYSHISKSLYLSTERGEASSDGRGRTLTGGKGERTDTTTRRRRRKRSCWGPAEVVR